MLNLAFICTKLKLKKLKFNHDRQKKLKIFGYLKWNNIFKPDKQSTNSCKFVAKWLCDGSRFFSVFFKVFFYVSGC